MKHALLGLVIMAACGPDLDTNEGVRRAVERATGRDPGEAVCVERPRALPRVVVVGSFAQDRGCALSGAFIDDDFLGYDALARDGLARLGFRETSGEAREALGRRFVLEVMHAYGGDFLTEPSNAFGLPDTPPFRPLEVRAEPDGSIVLEGWSRAPSGMTFEEAYWAARITIAPDGAVSEELLATFRVPGERLRRLSEAAR